MTYRGTVQGGVVVLEGGAGLPEGTVVSVEPVGQEKSLGKSGEGTTAEEVDELGRMGDLAVETGIPDLSVNHDHYLYGHPKVWEPKKGE